MQSLKIFINLIVFLAANLKIIQMSQLPYMLRAHFKLQSIIVILHNRFVCLSLEKTKSDKENIIKISLISYYRSKIFFNSREFRRIETAFFVFFFFSFFSVSAAFRIQFSLFFIGNSAISISLIFFSSARTFFFSFFLILRVSVISTSELLEGVLGGED